MNEVEGRNIGRIHFIVYDGNRQPKHVFNSYSYITRKDCKDLIEKIQLVFSIDNGSVSGFSLN